MSANSVVAVPSPPMKMVKSILFATDFSTPSEGAVKWLKPLARQLGTEVSIAHFRLLDDEGRNLQAPSGTDFQQEMTVLKRELEHHHGPRCRVVTADITREMPFVMNEFESQLRQIIEASQADMIVLATHAYRGFSRFTRGSFAETVIRLADCPVLTVGPEAAAAKPRHAIARVAFATDFSCESVQAIPVAANLAKQLDTKFTLLHVDRAPYEVRALGPEPPRDSDERLRRLAEAKSIPNAECVVLTGAVTEQLKKYVAANAIGMVALGVRRAIPEDPLAVHVSGSLVSKIVAQMPCPVLTFRGEFQEAALVMRKDSGF